MTKPINLYIQSRISDELSFNRVKFHSSKRQDCGKTKEHEIGSLRKIVDAFIAQGLSPKELDGFFFGFHIPQIGKEFDLLKFSQTEVINIEFKSQVVPEEQILTQLIKNKHYLAHLGKEEFLYTVVTDTMTCYELCIDNTIKAVDFSVISQKVKTFACNYLTDIDSMFRASEFLVSPLNTPEKFIRGEYFLTQAQEQIKKRILDTVSNLDTHGYVSLTGRPGTGKTLLLYDIAKELAKKDKTLIIHCGKLADGQDLLNKCINNFCVVSTAYLKRVPSVKTSTNIFSWMNLTASIHINLMRSVKVQLDPIKFVFSPPTPAKSYHNLNIEMRFLRKFMNCPWQPNLNYRRRFEQIKN